MQFYALSLYVKMTQLDQQRFALLASSGVVHVLLSDMIFFPESPTQSTVDAAAYPGVIFFFLLSLENNFLIN